MTSIYYMLTRESDHQWWALNESDHVHYHHAGGAVTYHLARADGTYERKTLGPDVERGQTPQLVVKGGTYKAAVLERGAEFAIIGEGVSPGFDFRDFKFVSASELARRNACYDDTSSLVKPQPEDTFDHYYAPTPPQEYFTPPGSETGFRARLDDFCFLKNKTETKTRARPRIARPPRRDSTRRRRVRTRCHTLRLDRTFARARVRVLKRHPSSPRGAVPATASSHPPSPRDRFSP